MLEIVSYSPTDPHFTRIVNRGGDIDAEISQTVSGILSDIRTRGSDALLDYVRKFDAPIAGFDALAISTEEMAKAEKCVPAPFLAAVRQAADNIHRFHQHQVRTGYTHDDGDGVVLAKRVLPIARVGVYCPAGTAPLFSSLLMNVISARIAGVQEIAVAIPPRKDGTVCPYMLATANHLGITELYRMGGAQAIAALAYGAGPVRRVDKIVGPGNAYVAMAKRQVFGTVGIDSVAGPSEIVIIADAQANPRFIAADLLSQVEHGSGYESGVVLTTDPALAKAVVEQTEQMLAGLDRADAIRRALSRYGAVFVCRNFDEAVEAANAIAPEHLEIMTAEPRTLLPGIINAGAVFLGPWSSEPVGDYFAGTNHVLPTTGAARFSSSLGVADFVKDMSIIEYSRQRLEQTGEAIVLMAETEGLTAHANAIKVRLEEISPS